MCRSRFPTSLTFVRFVITSAIMMINPRPAEATPAAHDTVYRKLRTRIMYGEIAPGRALTLRGIGKEYGVSMTPARESVRRLVAEGALLWQDEATDRKAGVVWGAAAPKTGDLRAEKRKQIHPAMGMVTRFAQLVARTVKRVLAKQRQKLQDDAEYVRGLREQWEPEAQARLAQISQGTDAGPS